MATARDKMTFNDPPTIDPDTGMLTTDFITAFRTKFIGPGAAPVWPKSGTERADAILDMQFVLNALLRFADQEIDVPVGAEGSAARLLAELIAEITWTEDEDDLPEPWKTNGVGTFRHYEIGCAMNIMMQAFNLTFAQGAPISWPPKQLNTVRNPNP